MNDSSFSHSDGLKTIEEMIQLAKGKVSDNSFYFILWGWVVLLGSLGTYILARLDYEDPTIAWSVIFLGVIGSIVYGIRQGKTTRVKTHLDHIYNMVWLVFGLNYLFLIGWSISSGNPQLISAFICVIAGTATFLSGMVIKFKPIIIGGLLLYLIGILAAIFVEHSMLLTALGMLVGYLVPGYMLKSRKK